MKADVDQVVRRRARRHLLVALLVAAGAVGLAASSAGAGPATVRVSVDQSGADADGASLYPAVSGNGRYVAFSSSAPDIVPGDANGLTDVFVRDLVAGTTARASVDLGGGDPNGPSTEAHISSDGRYVTFYSGASDLVPGDGASTDVFVRDMVAGTTVRASEDMSGGDPNGSSYDPAISGNGRFVAFRSYATDLVPGDRNNTDDIYVRDLATWNIARASVDVNGGDPSGDLYWNSYAAAVNGNGRFVAFASFADDLVDGDGNGTDDVFVRDMVTQTTIRVSLDVNGGDPSGYSNAPAIDASGRYVAYQSAAFDLVEGDGNRRPDVFLRDLAAGTNQRVSVDMNGGDANHQSRYPSISDDGRYVAFQSPASDLVAGDDNGAEDVFVRDMLTGTTTRVSVDLEGGDGNGVSQIAAISGNGAYVAFASTATDLVSGDGNGAADVFVRGVA